jgi:hypothetical protein
MKNHMKTRPFGIPLETYSGIEASLVMLIRLTAGGPDNAAEKDDNEAANHEKDHGRFPC